MIAEIHLGLLKGPVPLGQKPLECLAEIRIWGRVLCLFTLNSGCSFVVGNKNHHESGEAGLAFNSLH